MLWVYRIHSCLIVNIRGKGWRYTRKRNGLVGNVWLELVRCKLIGENSNVDWFREEMKPLPMRERNKDNIYGGSVDIANVLV